MNKHLFAGGITPLGFIDYFDNIMPLDKARKRYFLKGSSGSGKSTFMKKIAQEMNEQGISLNIYHCANDAKSIDAIASEDFCIIDATRPHIKDPEVPVAIDEVIDFAQFLDYDKLIKNVGEIKKILKEKSDVLYMANKYLKSAGDIYTTHKKNKERMMQKKYIKELASNLIPFSKNGYEANDTKFFLDAITPEGYKSLSNEYFAGSKIYAINTPYMAYIDYFLEIIKKDAHKKGITTTSFICPITNVIKYLYLKEVNTTFAYKHDVYGISIAYDEEINLSNSFTWNTEVDKIFIKTLNEATKQLKESKIIHTRLEEIYIEAMDFSGMEKLHKIVLKEAIKDTHHQ